MMRSPSSRLLQPVLGCFGPSLACRKAPKSTLLRLKEKNDALRERSESLLDKSRGVLTDDFKQHNASIGELRTAIKSREPITLHAPPAELYDHLEAFHFPPTEVRVLGGGPRTLSPADVFRGQRTLLGCAGSRFSEAMVDGWLDGVSAAIGAPAAGSGEGDRQSAAPDAGCAPATAPHAGAGGAAPALQIMRLALVEGLALSILRWPLMVSMRLTVPAARRNSFLVCFGNHADTRRRMRMENRYLGYVCLVDEQGVVRWHAHSSETPTTEQVARLAEHVR